jgi:DNA primase
MDISEIKTNLPLTQVLNHYNLKADKSARINCPFHEDKTPSMQLYYKTNTVYCFSSNCKTHGRSLDVIDFVMHKESCTKHEAIEKCKALINGNHAATANTGVSKETFLQNMFTYFKNAVLNSPPTKAYLQSRSLDFTQIEVGYNSGQFHHGKRKNDDLINNSLQYGLLLDVGLTSKTGERGYLTFGKNGIVFALRNKQNQITGLYFRSTVNNDNQKHFYLKDRKGIYPNYPEPGTKKIILTEAIIDAATLLQNPEINHQYSVIACYGTNGLNDEIKAAILELQSLEEIIFAFDNDSAGNAATTKYAKELQEHLPSAVFSRLELPNKDINETAQAHEPEIFLHLLKNRSLIFSNETNGLQHNNVGSTTQTTINTSGQNKNIEEINNIKSTEIVVKSSNTEEAKLNSNNPHKLIYTTTTATYVIKGGVDKVMSKLNVTLEISLQTHNNTMNKRLFKLDLYDTKQIEKTITEAEEHLFIHRNNLEKDFYHLTESLDQYRETLTNKEAAPEQNNEAAAYILTPHEKAQAMELAKDKELMATLQNKLSHTGIIGEEQNKTFLFVIAASHIQENPLNALIQGSSGSGKTNLLKGIYKLMPDENKKIYSRCSEKMLYNVPKYYFQNKLICFEDVDGLGEEAEYAWRELVSNGELTSGVSFKDEKGNIGIKELIVHGPITSIACTTHGAIYADNMSRLFLIAIDESKEQTKKINEYQAKEAAGLINKQEQQHSITQLKNYIRLLNPCQVHNPHATKLKLPEGVRDERRLYRLYLYFIDMITVLHQYQRNKTAQGKLIATKQDCQIAKELMFECIMLKMDELDGSLRQFFERLKDYVSKQTNPNYEFTQREIREALQVKKTLLSYHVYELMSLEYIQQTSSHINKGNRYKILHYDNYRKTREDVKAFLQNQINDLDE